MGYLYKGDAILKGNLSVLTDKPLDERSIVQNVTNMLTISSTSAYNGMPIVNIDEKAIYILLDKTNISKLDSWKRIGTVTINNNEIDLSSFVTSTELSGQLDILKGEISTDINTKISESKTEILSEVDTKISTSKTEILSEVDTKIDEALESFTPGSGGGSSLVIDEVLTETSSNPVKSSGIYNGVKTMINAKFVVLTEAEYKAMDSHDANTFYYIKQ